MLALMVGSKLYSIFIGSNTMDSKKLLLLSTFLASFSFLICSFAVSDIFVDYLPYTIITCYYCFIVFEISIGIYLPSMIYLKSIVIPEKIRVTISNVIKIPSNIFICLALLWIHFVQENQKTNVNIVFTIYIVSFVATFVTFIFSKIFAKCHAASFKDIIKCHETGI